jgi:hypothetical protein
MLWGIMSHTLLMSRETVHLYFVLLDLLDLLFDYFLFYLIYYIVWKEFYMFKIVFVKALPEYKLKLEYSDGTKGEVDVSHLAGKGVFKKWEIPGEFEKVSIGSMGELVWGNDIDICPDSLYLRLTGKKPEEVFPPLKREVLHA